MLGSARSCVSARPCHASLRVCPHRGLGSPNPALPHCGEELQERWAEAGNVLQAARESL